MFCFTDRSRIFQRRHNDRGAVGAEGDGVCGGGFPLPTEEASGGGVNLVP